MSSYSLSYRFFFFSLLIFVCQAAIGQRPITIKGFVKDKKSLQPLEFVPLTITSRTAGTYTDSLGKFSFKAFPKDVDSLIITYIGYYPKYIALSDNSTQEFEIFLEENVGELPEIIIKADPNPGKTIMKKVIAANPKNDPSTIKKMESKRWERNEVYLFHPREMSAADPLDFIFSSRVKAHNATKSDTDTSKSEIPLFFSESISSYILTNDPFGETENLIAVKKTNLESDKLLEHMCRMDEVLDLYQSKIVIYTKAFVSPIGSLALDYYDYYIEDSTSTNDGHFNITLQLIPKSWHGNVFTGNIVIHDSSFALVQADLRLSKEANLNFVEKMQIKVQYDQSFDPLTKLNKWYLKRNELLLQYEAGLELIGIPLPLINDDRRLVATVKNTYYDVKLNPSESTTNTRIGTSAVMRVYDSGHSDEFWKSARPDSLSSRESAIYDMAEAINNNKIQKLKDILFKTITTGWYNWNNKLWIGPYGSLVSKNEIEGWRFRVRVRTDEAWMKKTGLYSHLAYGLKDGKWKGSFGIKQLWNVQPYTKSEAFYGNDFLIASEWYDALDADNIVNTIFRKKVPYQRVLQEQWNLSHDQQFASDWYFRVGGIHRTLTPFQINYICRNPEFISPEKTPDISPELSVINSSEVSIALRYAYRERARIFDYERRSLGSRYPTVNLSYTHSIQWKESHFNFQKWNIGILHRTYITPKWTISWNADVGKIFGKVPLLLAYIPRGNESYFTTKYAFNTMNKYEFVADRYASVQATISFGGTFFDYIPGINKLGWRERILVNSFWGDLSKQNKDFNYNSIYTTADKQPFLEFGAGIENIFHLFSIDYIYRANYKRSGPSSGLFAGIRAFF
ncbi:MAG TPA: DUF5686 family protein [Saprospiraceae bacterium]|nr:DUF5686 family protein [Saprospiraceae bacterium]